MTSPSRSPRGVETALRIWEKVEKGALISEQLRALADSVSPPDRTLAASLCYAMARRLSLWQHLRTLFMLPKPSKYTRAAQTAVLCGACGKGKQIHNQAYYVCNNCGNKWKV